MRTRIDTAELRNREYWTAEHAARVLGRGADFWRAAFDRGDVTGYSQPHFSGANARYMQAASCRDYLKRLAENPPVRTYKAPRHTSAGLIAALESDPEYAQHMVEPKRRPRRIERVK